MIRALQYLLYADYFALYCAIIVLLGLLMERVSAHYAPIPESSEREAKEEAYIRSAVTEFVNRENDDRINAIVRQLRHEFDSAEYVAQSDGRRVA